MSVAFQDARTLSKILLVEDDPTYGRTIKQCLSTDGHVVDCVTTATEAAEYLQRYGYDLIVLDWMLPDLSGPDLCKSLRSNGIDVPVLMLTAKSEIDDTVIGLDSGADDYLGKPAHPAALLARVRALLRRPRPVKLSVIQVRQVTMHLDTRRVLVDGREIELLPREYALLEFLCTHPNQVFTAEALVDRLWPSTVTSAHEVVRATVSRLRGKLDNGGKSPIIRTVYSVGYTIDNP